MTTAVKRLLESFDALSEPERREAVAELLSRHPLSGGPDLSEDALIAVADERFADLDADEAGNAVR